MRRKSTGAPSLGKRPISDQRQPGKKAVGKRGKKHAVGRAVAERVTAVLDKHDALRTPLKDAMRERFCQALLLASSATAAAISAGYSPATAKQQASRLLTFVDVQRRLAGLFAQTAQHRILRRTDVLCHASQRADAAMADIADLVGLPWDEFCTRIRSHPAARAIKKVKRGVSFDLSGKHDPVVFVKEIELFDPRCSERLLADLLGWEAPKRVEVTTGQGRVLYLPAQIPAPLGELEPAAGGDAEADRADDAGVDGSEGHDGG